MLIFRYLCREVFALVTVIMLVMLAILLMSQAALYLSGTANGSLSISFFGKFMLIDVPFITSYVLPFAFYFALLLAYSRFYADSEMVVMQTSGFSNRRLFFYSMSIAIVVMIIVAYLVFIANPILASERGKFSHYSEANILRTIIPGEFKVLNQGKLVLYAAKANHDKSRLQSVFFAQLDNNVDQQWRNRWTINFATEAHRVIRDNGHAYLQTANGYQYKGIPGSLNYSILQYKDYSYLLGNSISINYHGLSGVSTTQLWLQRNNVLALSEFEWRVSLVLQVLVLTLFAIPLSRVQPRQGRYAKILLAVLFYLVYVNVIFVARYLLENNMISTCLGLWWAHLFMLLLIGLYKVYHRYR